jgi:ArsR family transcriptional regulator
MARETLDCILTALADPIRRRALALLHSRDELCVCELMSALGVTQSRMSRHMSTLKAAGLVLDRRDAQWVRYRLNPDTPPAIAAVVGGVIQAMPGTPRSRGQANRRSMLRERAMP